ncbi:MAG: DUF4238 domain-containing protein, partial [Blastocatellia bacterium]|nr:DUF4238 domain-containing protein [Blastocatellia bacterium]
MAASPQRHHFIPQFYQRGFLTGSAGLIWVYEKYRQPRLRPLRKTGMELDLYGFTNQQGEFDSQTIESALGVLETNTAPVIKKLEAGNLPNDLERKHLAKFISVLLRRTPKHKASVRKMGKEMMPEFFEEHDEKWLFEHIKKRVGDDDKAEQIFEAKKIELQELREKYLQEAPDWLFPTNILRESLFEQILLRMDWAYFRSSPTIEFLTCDNPVAFSQGTGLKDREAVIMCPLTRTLFLQAMWISSY